MTICTEARVHFPCPSGVWGTTAKIYAGSQC